MLVSISLSDTLYIVQTYENKQLWTKQNKQPPTLTHTHTAASEFLTVMRFRCMHWSVHLSPTATEFFWYSTRWVPLCFDDLDVCVCEQFVSVSVYVWCMIDYQASNVALVKQCIEFGNKVNCNTMNLVGPWAKPNNMYRKKGSSKALFNSARKSVETSTL